MKIPDYLHSKIEAEKVSLMLLGGLSEAEAERRAVAKVKADEAAKPKTQPATSTSPKVSHPVDTEAAKDGAWFRARMLEPLNVEITGILAEGDWADYNDEQLEELVKSWGFA
jgi:hypothetical protein